MTIKNALIWAYNKLKNIDSPQLDAEVLLSFVLKKNKSYIYTYPEKKITANQLKKFKNLISRRINNYPVAYLIKNKEFYGLNFYVDARVLIPRPATESLVDEATKLIKKYKYRTIADIGTGSGCIAISLKKRMPKLKVYATDISSDALSVARKNSKIHNVEIILRQGDLLNPIKNIKTDLIVANLPYVDYQTYHKKKSIKYEPKEALLAKNKGLEFIQKLIQQIAPLTKKPSAIILEFESTQKFVLEKNINKLLSPKKINSVVDLNGKKRFVIVIIK